MRAYVSPASLLIGALGCVAVTCASFDSRAGDAGETESLVVSVPVEKAEAESVRYLLGNISLQGEELDAGDHVLLAQAVDDDANDPLEPVNRAIFSFNQAIYDGLFTPIALEYNARVPALVRSSLGNVIDNLASPVTLANDLLQLELTRAMTTIARFLVNTIAGLGGMADVAADIGLKQHKEDFGQTLGSYGVGEGVYLVLPLLGPSNPRDAIGKYLVDPYFDPLGLYLKNTDRDAAIYTRTGVGALDEYASIIEELSKIRKTSVDYYAAIRSLYRQKRTAEISNGRDDGLPPIPNYDLNFVPDTNGGIANAN